MFIPPASKKQKLILSCLQDYKNVVVDSVASSGKTTTNLHIANTFPEKKILLLTYNSKLKIETRRKVDDCKLNNIEVHSYHSFAYKFYKYCTTDTELKSIVNEALTPKIRYAFDLIVLDEAQDITPLLFELICKIFRDNENSSKNLWYCIQNNVNQRPVVGPQLCILGDKFQTIFEV